MSHVTIQFHSFPPHACPHQLLGFGKTNTHTHTQTYIYIYIYIYIKPLNQQRLQSDVVSSSIDFLFSCSFGRQSFCFIKWWFDEETRLKDDATMFLCQRMLNHFPHAVHVLSLSGRILKKISVLLFIFIVYQDTNYYKLEQYNVIIILIKENY